MYTLDANIFARDANPRDPFYATCHALLERLASTAAPVIEPGLLLAEVAGAIAAQHAIRCGPGFIWSCSVQSQA